MTIHYRIFGLTFRSDCELPGLDRTEETSPIDYSLKLDNRTNGFELLRREFNVPCYASSWRIKTGQPFVQVKKKVEDDSHKVLFRFYDGVEFIIDRGRQEICVGDLRKASLQAATHHLLFSLPGFLLILRSSACLQGAVFGRGEVAIALLGASMSGKSVLSACIASRGMDVLSDDFVALDVIGSTVMVHPGYPWICLRPGSVGWLGTDVFDASRLSSRWHYLDEAYVTWDLRRVGSTFQSRPRKLEAVYLLVPIDDSRCKFRIERVPGDQALMALMTAASRTHIPCRKAIPQEFSLMGLIAATLPTFRLRYFRSAESLMALSDLLVHLPRLRSIPWEKVKA